MKDFLKHFPGFRTNKIWKKVVASIFYVLFLLSIIGSGFEGLFFVGGIGLLGFSVYEFVSNKRNNKGIKVPVIMLVIAIMLLSTGGNINSENQAIAENNKQIETLTKENQELKSLNEDLKLQYESFESQKESLESENKELKEHNEDLKVKIEELEKEIEELQQNIKELEARKEQEKKAASSSQSPTKSSTQSSPKSSAPANNSRKSSDGGGSSTSAATQTGQGQVYETPTGSKYHRKACGNGNYTATTLEKAKARGLTPCQKCY